MVLTVALGGSVIINPEPSHCLNIFATLSRVVAHQHEGAKTCGGIRRLLTYRRLGHYGLAPSPRSEESERVNCILIYRDRPALSRLTVFTLLSPHSQH